MSTIDKDKYFEDSLLPKFSKEGIPMRDPRDINDPDYDKPVGNFETENFTFDMSGGIAQVCEFLQIYVYFLKLKGPIICFIEGRALLRPC